MTDDDDGGGGGGGGGGGDRGVSLNKLRTNVSAFTFYEKSHMQPLIRIRISDRNNKPPLPSSARPVKQLCSLQAKLATWESSYGKC